MSSSTLNEDGQAMLSPSSFSQDNNLSMHSDSSDDELEVVIGPPVATAVASAQQVAPAAVAPAQQVAPAAVAPAQQVAPAVAVPTQQVAPAVGTPLVNVRYTTVPLLPMVLDPNSTHVSPWYTVIVGRFIGVFEDTGAADKATRKVSCSSHKAHQSQQAAVNGFNMAQALGDLEIVS